MAELPSFAAEWLRQRTSGAPRVAAIEADELRALGDDEALRLSDALLDAVPIEAAAQARRDSSGFVIQQRYFARARR